MDNLVNEETYYSNLEAIVAFYDYLETADEPEEDDWKLFC
jgi:hypothetical protein